MTTPYTYLITFKETKQKYYGVRYAKNCHPSDLWNTYFTSSKVVQVLLTQYGPSAFTVEIRKVFQTQEAACKWENKVLRRLKVHLREDYLNICHNYTFSMYNPEVAQKVKQKNVASGLFSKLGKMTQERMKANNFDYGSLSRKSYIIIYDNGEEVFVTNLKEYAEQINVRYDQLRACSGSGNPYPKGKIKKVVPMKGIKPLLQEPQSCVQITTPHRQN